MASFRTYSSTWTNKNALTLETGYTKSQISQDSLDQIFNMAWDSSDKISNMAQDIY